MNRHKWLILGAIIGAALGLLGASIDILVWNSMGRPAVLVRDGWESVHLAVTVFGGFVAGAIYGTILGSFTGLERRRKNAVFVFPLTFFFAMGLYAAGAFVTVKLMHIAPWLCGHAIVFVVALAVAYVGLGPSGDTIKATPR